VIVLREVIGGELRRRRQAQGRTLRDVSSAARVSLGYLSEVERGQKEASSELLSAICGALDAPLSTVLADASRKVAMLERKDKPADLVRSRVVLPGEGAASAYRVPVGARS
jgi:transcriptional regulator with XRE-family HTH domain